MKHLEEVGETYWEHFLTAAGVSHKLAVASWCQLLHAVLPSVSPPCGCDLKSLIAHLESKLPENRNKPEEEEELYTVYGGD
tara:strand:+ start:3539 stop:3781 length:243 start_codon:yes stop_codon:yes gene_type:complete